MLNLRILLSWLNIVVHNIFHEVRTQQHYLQVVERNILFTRKFLCIYPISSEHKINIRKDGKIKNILIAAIFFIRSISTVLLAITPITSRDAFVILTTETVTGILEPLNIE